MSKELDTLVESAVLYCQQRHPEALDKIFDNQPLSFNHQLFLKAIATLKTDIDTLSWFCGYLASEINRSEDNYKDKHPITDLSHFLISAGMEPITDFMPYPGCRIVITNTDKFESLPVDIQEKVHQFFVIQETSGEEAQLVNNALLQELVVTQQ